MDLWSFVVSSIRSLHRNSSRTVDLAEYLSTQKDKIRKLLARHDEAYKAHFSQ
jgi:hypothetical protein